MATRDFLSQTEIWLPIEDKIRKFHGKRITVRDTPGESPGIMFYSEPPEGEDHFGFCSLRIQFQYYSPTPWASMHELPAVHRCQSVVVYLDETAIAEIKLHPSKPAGEEYLLEISE